MTTDTLVTLHDVRVRLRSGVAGAVVQEFVTHRLRLVVVGDVSGYIVESTALRDFVHETDNGGRSGSCRPTTHSTRGCARPGDPSAGR